MAKCTYGSFATGIPIIAAASVAPIEAGLAFGAGFIALAYGGAGPTLLLMLPPSRDSAGDELHPAAGGGALGCWCMNGPVGLPSAVRLLSWHAVQGSVCAEADLKLRSGHV